MTSLEKEESKEADPAYNHVLQVIEELEGQDLDVYLLISDLQKKYSLSIELASIKFVRAWYNSESFVRLRNIPHFSEKLNSPRTTSMDEKPTKITGQPKIIYKWQKCGSNCRCNNGRGHGPYAHEVVWDKEKKKYIWKYLGKIEKGIHMNFLID